MAVHQGKRRRRFNLGWSTDQDERLLQAISLHVYLVLEAWGHFTHDSMYESTTTASELL